MARAGVQDHVDRLARQLRAGTLRRPGVFADLEADPHAGEIEDQIADRVLHAAHAGPRPAPGRPRLEPARLVVDAVAGERPLRDEAEDLRRRDEAAHVVDTAVVRQR
jgi:hypothetical protein